MIFRRKQGGDTEAAHGHDVQQPRDTPEQGSAGSFDGAGDGAENDGDEIVLLEGDTLEIARLAGEMEAHRRARQRLTETLDRLLPLAHAYAQVAPQDGGPDHDQLVEDPDRPGSFSLPEIIEAERALFEADALDNDGDEHDQSAGFRDYTDDDFLEVGRTASQDRAEVLPVSLEDSVAAASAMLEQIKAHKIVGLEASQALRDRYETVLKILAGNLAERFAVPDASSVIDVVSASDDNFAGEPTGGADSLP